MTLNRIQPEEQRQILLFLSDGRVIDAIRAIRAESPGMALEEAKNITVSIARQHGYIERRPCEQCRGTGQVEYLGAMRVSAAPKG